MLRLSTIFLFIVHLASDQIQDVRSSMSWLSNELDHAAINSAACSKIENGVPWLRIRHYLWQHVGDVRRAAGAAGQLLKSAAVHATLKALDLDNDIPAGQ